MIFIATFVLAIFFHRIKVSQWLGRPVETFVFVICPEFQQRTWVGDYSVLGSLLIIVIFNQLYFPSIYLEVSRDVFALIESILSSKEIVRMPGIPCHVKCVAWSECYQC